MRILNSKVAFLHYFSNTFLFDANVPFVYFKVIGEFLHQSFSWKKDENEKYVEIESIITII